MNIPKKKENKIEYIKRLLLQESKTACDYCKYHISNYTDMFNIEYTTRVHFQKKCESCIHLVKYIRLSEEERKKYYWYRDEFKPLYDWEDENPEGDQNGDS